MQRKYGIHDIPPDLNPSVYEEISEMVDHLLGLSLYEIDFEAAKKLCRAYFTSEVYEIKRMSILCAGHIVRVYEQMIDEDMVEEIKKIAADPNSDFCGTAQNALWDMDGAMMWKKKRMECPELEEDAAEIYNEPEEEIIEIGPQCCNNMYNCITKHKIIRYSKEDLIYSISKDSSEKSLSFCPWCGTKLPDGLGGVQYVAE
jgi:hypothetical protein